MIRVKTHLKISPLMILVMMVEIVEQIQKDMTSEAA